MLTPILLLCWEVGWLGDRKSTPSMQLRAANLGDLDFILDQEAREEFSQFILCWNRDKHAQNLDNRDLAYFMVEGDRDPVIGYVILSGLNSPHRNVELTRIVIAQPGQGYGTEALKLVLAKVFEEYKAHRVWLDVFELNHRARHVYKVAGFRKEGMLREAYKRGEDYYSLVIMAMLESEYAQFDRRSLKGTNL